MTILEWKQYLATDELDGFIRNQLCGDPIVEKERYLSLIPDNFDDTREWFLFSSPGRSEIIGNHTDHQKGRVIGASVNVDTIGFVCACEGIIRLDCQGFGNKVVSLDDVSFCEKEMHTTESILRGMVAIFREKGYRADGFEGYVTSSVLAGSGISSSASFELLIAQVLNHLYNDGQIPSNFLAQIAQEVENRYFGKPCGLADQMAIACGGFTFMDFENDANPHVLSFPFSFDEHGYSLVLIDSKEDHSSLSEEYATMPSEMKSVAHFFSKEVLRQVSEKDFLAKMPELLYHFGNDRAILRSIHYFEEEKRVLNSLEALKKEDIKALLENMKESGNSSYKYLQNAFLNGSPKNQRYALALAISERILQGHGVTKVHGGGLAGTIQAIVKKDYLAIYCPIMESYFGRGSVKVLSIRPKGSVKIC